MNINIKIFVFMNIISMFWLHDVNATDLESKQSCPSGCFCVFDGKVPKRFGLENICGRGNVAQPVLCDGDSEIFNFVKGICDDCGVLSCTRDNVSATYYMDEFSEVFQGIGGMYGFIGEDLIVMPTKEGFAGNVGVYQCPNSYPNSAPGAKTLYECFRYDYVTGAKVYYEPRQNTVKTLTADLQQTLNNANQTVLNLKGILDLVPTTNFHVNNNVIINNVEVAPVNPDLEIAKQMIDLGITNVPKKLQKNQNNNTNDNYENVEPVNPDLEKAKQMIDLGITNVPKISDKDKNNKSNNMDNGLTQPMKLRKSVTNKVAPKSTLPKTPIKPKL
jgi:hypothetical protein